MSCGFSFLAVYRVTRGGRIIRDIVFFIVAQNYVGIIWIVAALAQ